MQIRRGSGRLTRWLLLAAALSSGCAMGPGPSPYRVAIPVLEAQPTRVQCAVQTGQRDACIVVLERDWRAVVRELKSACLATGQSMEACQGEVQP